MSAFIREEQRFIAIREKYRRIANKHRVGIPALRLMILIEKHYHVYKLRGLVLASGYTFSLIHAGYQQLMNRKWAHWGVFSGVQILELTIEGRAIYEKIKPDLDAAEQEIEGVYGST